MKFPYKVNDSPLPFFLPNFSIESIKFKEFPENFVIIRGKRCHYKCNRLTKQCDALKCWNRPSICIGEVNDCAKLDGDGTCTDAQMLKKIRGRTENYSSTDFRSLLDLPYDRISINEHGIWDKHPAHIVTWVCSLTSEFEVECYLESGSIRTYSGSLKEIAG